MSYTAVIKYLSAAPADEIDKIAEFLRKKQEKAEIDAAIARGIADIDAGRFFTAEEFDRRLKEKYGI